MRPPFLHQCSGRPCVATGGRQQHQKLSCWPVACIAPGARIHMHAHDALTAKQPAAACHKLVHCALLVCAMDNQGQTRQGDGTKSTGCAVAVQPCGRGWRALRQDAANGGGHVGGRRSAWGFSHAFCDYAALYNAASTFLYVSWKCSGVLLALVKTALPRKHRRQPHSIWKANLHPSQRSGASASRRCQGRRLCCCRSRRRRLLVLSWPPRHQFLPGQ